MRVRNQGAARMTEDTNLILEQLKIIRRETFVLQITDQARSFERRRTETERHLSRSLSQKL
jgi:hypothetical protein